MNGYWENFNWPLFSGFIVVIIIFLIYSYVALNQLRKYGYVGDLCEKAFLIYPTISILIIIISLLFYIFA